MSVFVKKWLAACAFVMAVCGASLAGQTPLDTVSGLEAQAKSAEEAGRLKEAFDLYVRAVQGLADPPPFEMDLRLRERLIALATQVEPRPTAPQDAERFSIRGQALFKDAKDEAGLEAAALEFRKAVRTAPWAPDLAYNLALVQEKQEYYDSASRNLKLYLLSGPPDAKDVQAKVYELEVKTETNALAAAKEKCNRGTSKSLGAVDSDPAEFLKFFGRSLDDGCGRLGIEGGAAWARNDYRTAYPLLKLACDKGHEGCDTLGLILIAADMADQTRARWSAADVHGADTLKSMGVSLSHVTGVMYLLDACRQHPEHCLLSLFTPYQIATNMERDYSRKTVRTDELYEFAWGLLDCSRNKEDCLAKGLLAELGVGTKKDRNAAKKFYDAACAEGVTKACEQRKKLGR